MSVHDLRHAHLANPWRRQRGAALIVTSVLLVIVALLSVTGLVAASLELQMSGNQQYQERAFQAAEFAVQQALNSAPLSTTYTITNPKTFPAPGVDALVPGAVSDTYAYRLFYDNSAGGTPLPNGSDSDAALLAYHFVISSTGHSSRGAQAMHTQGFYVIGPASCAVAGAECNFDTAARIKSFWIQQSAE